uniref:globin-2-like n=1 Tax=Myxine glutinosa TaxID=7769 RepID=UPI00358FF0C1
MSAHGIARTTEAERAAVRASWAVLMKDYENAGVQILDKFFKANPAAKPFFTKMKDLHTLDDLANSADARWHVERIIQAVNFAVTNIEDREKLSNKFVKLSQDHIEEFHVTDPQYFMILSQTILDEVEKRNGGLSGEGKSGWHKVMTIICKMLKSKY